MKKLFIIKKFLPLLMFLFIILTPLISQAAGSITVTPQPKQTESFRVSSGFASSQGEAGLATIIAGGIQIVLSLLGILFIILMIISGFKWMTAGGNEEQVTKARKNITSAIFGLFIILAAYAVTWFIFYYMPLTAAAPGAGGGGTTSG